jgi:hypothetical protein
VRGDGRLDALRLPPAVVGDHALLGVGDDLGQCGARGALVRAAQPAEQVLVGDLARRDVDGGDGDDAATPTSHADMDLVVEPRWT